MARKRLLRPALADRNGRVSHKQLQPPRSGGSTQRFALRAFDLPPVSWRRAGAEKARRVARMDSGQLGVSAGMHCRQTPEPACAVVRRHRTTDPPRAHLLVTFLCEQKSDWVGGSRTIRLTHLAIAEHSESVEVATMERDARAGPSPRPSPDGRGRPAPTVLPAEEGTTTSPMGQHRNRINRR